MAVDDADRGRGTSAAASPLAVIALFIGLSEATVGAAAVGTDGASQLMLSVFAVVFPVIVFGVFVWMLLVHPAHLYPPDQYTPHTPIKDFAEALQRRPALSHAQLELVLAPQDPEERQADLASELEQQKEIADEFYARRSPARESTRGRADVRALARRKPNERVQHVGFLRVPM